MPAIEGQFRCQKAVYWAASGINDYGVPTLDSPVEIDVRWDEGRTESINSQGSPVALDVQVVVDQDMVIGSVMWLGYLDDLPSPLTSLYDVVQFSKVPDVKGREFRRTVSLKKHGDSLPDLT
jgi:hypothetical protein